MSASRVSPRPFLDHPLRWRRNRFVAQRWLSRQDTQGSGVFSTPIVLLGSAEGDRLVGESGAGAVGCTDHAWCKFVSRVREKDGWLYHADFSTVSLEAEMLMETWVDAQVEDRLRAAGLNDNDAYPSFRGGVSIASSWPRLAALGNLTVWGAQAQEWERLLADPALWPSVQAGYRLDFSCATGIDLFAVVERKSLDQKTLKEEVEAFWASGEASVQRPVSLVSHEKELRQALGATVQRSWAMDASVSR